MGVEIDIGDEIRVRRPDGQKGDPEAAQFAQELAESTKTLLSAISGDKDVQIQFGGDQEGSSLTTPPPGDGKTPVLPETIEAGTAEGRRRARAGIDSAAAWLAHHNHDLHTHFAPASEHARQVYDMLEKARCDALLGRRLKGTHVNLEQALKDYVQEQAPNDPAAQQALVAAYMMMRQETTGEDMTELNARYVEAQSKNLDRNILSTWEKLGNAYRRVTGQPPLTAAQKLKALAQHADNPEEYARHARKLAYNLASLFDLKDKAWKPEDTQNKQNKQDAPPGEGDNPAAKNGNSAPSQAQKEPSKPKEEKKKVSLREAFTEKAPDDVAQLDDAPLGDKERRVNGAPPLIDPLEIDPGYKIYTTEFDRVISGREFVGYNSPGECRQRLDREMTSYKTLVGRLAAKLQRKLLAMQRRSWSYDLEDGKLDPARLVRVVTTPDQPLAYKEEKKAPFKETIVTILVDNSGSMRGDGKIVTAAMTTDILAQTLERAGIKTEILGFATDDNNKSARKALASGTGLSGLVSRKPEGRMEDLLHVVYKNASQPYRRCREDIACMLGGRLDQNVDGEALVWAYNRIARRPEERKILIVISDGDPAAGYFTKGESADYYGHAVLATHLEKVTKFIEDRTPVELVAIGIQNDVRRFYKNAVVIQNPSQLAPVLIGKLDALFDPPEKSGRRSARKAVPKARV